MLAEANAGGFMLTFKEDDKHVPFGSEVTVRDSNISGVSWAKIEVGPMLLQGPEQHESPVVFVNRSRMAQIAPEPPGSWPKDIIVTDFSTSSPDADPTRVWFIPDAVLDALREWLRSR